MRSIIDKVYEVNPKAIIILINFAKAKTGTENIMTLELIKKISQML